MEFWKVVFFYIRNLGRPADRPAGRPALGFRGTQNNKASRVSRRAEFRGGQSFGAGRVSEYTKKKARSERAPSGAAAVRTMSCSDDELFG